MYKTITDDSRLVTKGGTFIAVRGYKADGHRFIDDAIARGARVIVTQKDFAAPKGVSKILVADTRLAMPVLASDYYGHPSRKLKVVGVTGTNGKTTITYLIENILKAARKSCGVIGTINYRIKGKEVPAPNTTPGSIELQSILSRIYKSGARYAIMEVSSHSLDQHRVDCVLFDVAIFTNITREHLDYHKTLKRYFEAKIKLFGKLKKGGIAVLNNDDKKVASLKSKIRNKVITYALENNADVTVRNISLSLKGSFFTVDTPKGSVDIRTKLIGKHNVSNILASVAGSIALGIPLGAIRKGIESFTYVPGRLESIESGQPFRIFVDFAHTEDALYNILSLLKEVATGGRIITVFGCGGNRDKTKRPLMGRAACRFSDKVVVTSDNPRFEDPAEIIKEIESGIRGKFSNYDIIEDRRDAIDRALKLAAKGDVVVIAGKGHEKYQIVKDKIMPFDDCKVARELLKNLC